MGIIFIARPNHIVGVLPALIGILILLDGGMRIQTAKDAKVLGYERWWLVLSTVKAERKTIINAKKWREV